MSVAVPSKLEIDLRFEESYANFLFPSNPKMLKIDLHFFDENYIRKWNVLCQIQLLNLHISDLDRGSQASLVNWEPNNNSF